jgi:dephospho-CoA kinase
MKVVSVVGMAGAGKSEVARVFEESGYTRIRFGDVTEEEIKKRGLLGGEANERYIRELLRKEYGMVAYAVLNLPKIEKAMQKSNVVIDGLYSWEEYVFLKNRLGDVFHVVAVCAPPVLRYARLAERPVRRLTGDEARERDQSEIENLNKGGPIAMADYIVPNVTDLDGLREKVREIVVELEKKD